MLKAHFKDLMDRELVREFIDAAQSLGVAQGASNSGIPEARRLVAIDAELRARGRAARLRLLPILDEKDRVVRYYAAQRLLGIAPDRARGVIEETANCWFDSIAADARMTVRRLSSGGYKPD
jgi:hypothetical protein